MAKRRISLVPMDALELITDVIAYGAAKHGEGNWAGVDDPETWFLDKAWRHISDHRKGRHIDESGLPALAHAAANLLLWLAVSQHGAPETAVKPMTAGAAKRVKGHVARGKTRKEAGAIEQLSPAQVRKALANGGGAGRQEHPAIEAIRRGVFDGHSKRAIAESLGVSEETVRRWYIRAGRGRRP